MRVLAHLAAASVLVTAPLLGPPSSAAAAVSPGITVLSITGSGCRPNTTAAALTPDRAAVSITYNDYVVASAGAARFASRNCRIRLRIDPVRGSAPTITSVDYRGFADLAARSAALLTATYRFDGATSIRATARWVTGPFSDAWQVTDAAEPGLVAGRCGGSSVLNIDSTLSLTSGPAGAATDLVTMDSTDAAVPTTFRLAWRRCS
jgi:hypothetical protein